MTTSIFLAQLIGPFFLLVGLSLLVNQAQFGIIANEFLQSPALVFLTGLIILPAGLAVVLTHNVWVADWRVLITLLGWLSLISGVIRLLVPKRALDVGRRLYARPNILHVSAAIWLVVGAVLSFYGYLR